MLLVNSQDDPLVPEKLLETPKKYVNSMYDYTIEQYNTITTQQAIELTIQ
jgi:predicted alpha/beta-fold hydrolase